jgi:hypothetical protein
MSTGSTAHILDPRAACQLRQPVSLGGIDLGIVRAVKVLRDAGVEAFESCQGGNGDVFPAAAMRVGGNSALDGRRCLCAWTTAFLSVACDAIGA